MKVNHQDLKDKYENLSTDQLIHVKITSELTDTAQMLVDDELKKRNVSVEDYNRAVRDANIIKVNRDFQKNSIKRKFQFQFHFIYLFICLSSLFL